MTHAQLLEQMKRLGLTEAQTINWLMDKNLISDHCIRIWDIAGPDLACAVQALASRQTALDKKPALL